MAATQLQSMSAHHFALVDFIIENAHEKGWRSLACAQFNLSPAYLSIVFHSDVFREEYFRRLTQWREGVTNELRAKQMRVASIAYDKLLKILENDGTEDSLVLDIANTTMKSLGFAPSPGAAPNVTKETEITRIATRELAPGILEQARVTYKKVTSEQLPSAVNE